MADKKKDDLLPRSAAEGIAARNAELKQFIEADKRLTARREGKVGIPPPPNADIGIWQKIQQEIGKKGFLTEGRKGNWKYAEPQKTGAEPSEKKPKRRSRHKKHPSITI